MVVIGYDNIVLAKVIAETREHSGNLASAMLS